MAKPPTVINPNTNALDPISFAAKISTEDMIDAFVTRYETNQDSLRADLSTSIATARKKVEKSKENLVNKGTKLANTYKGARTIAGIIITITGELNGVHISEGQYKIIQNLITDNENETSTVKQFDLPIPTKDLTAHNKLVKVVTDFEAKLSVVMYDLANLPKKTRQVRGLIAERKMTAAGMDSLINDIEMQKLLS